MGAGALACLILLTREEHDRSHMSCMSKGLDSAAGGRNGITGGDVTGTMSDAIPLEPIWMSLLPHGPYQATLVSRQTLPPMGNAGAKENPGVEMTVSISAGPYVGQHVSFRAYGAARMQRARAFTQGQQLRIHIGHHQLDDGRVVNRVADFDALGAASAIDLQRGFGRDDGDACLELVSTAETSAQPNDDLAERLRRVVTGDGTHVAGDFEQGTAETALTPPDGCDALGEQYPIGFWSNRKQASRTIVSYEDACRSYAAADERILALGEGYLSVCQYSSELLAHRDGNEKKSLAGYRGATWARWLAIDIDGDNSAEGLNNTLHDVRRLVAALVALGVPRSHVLTFFSGKRGVHVLFPSTAFAAASVERFEKAAGAVCGLIADLAGVKIDESLYSPLKSLRAPNTRHDETGLYKVFISLDELEALTSEAVIQMARQPRPFQVPDWRVAPAGLLVELWQWACRADEAPQQPTATAVRSSISRAGEPHLFAATIDLIVHGAPDGTRGSRFFRAAVNLLDFSCPEELLIALLEPAARLSNYPPDEFMSQIQGAIRAHALSRNNTPV
jgi:hypothetical protein